MSHPTKAVYRYLMSDFVRVSYVGAASHAPLRIHLADTLLHHSCSTAGTDDKLFTEEEMVTSWNSILGFDFEQEILLAPSATSNTAVRFTSFAAGHVLGACMFLIEIAGTRVLYTGDYSTEEDRHLVPAKVPTWEKKPDVMICESTYGCVYDELALQMNRTADPHSTRAECRVTSRGWRKRRSSLVSCCSCFASIRVR